MKVTITRTTPIYAPTATSGVFVQWDVLDVPTADSDLRFTLERAGAPNGPFTVVQAGIQDYHFYDQHLESWNEGHATHDQLSMQRHTYYRVTATAGSVFAQAIEPVGDQLPRPVAMRRRKMQRDLRLQLKTGAGTPYAVLKRRHWGCRCTACFDKLTKTVTNSKCLVCFGTGFQGGYHAPVIVTARRGVTNVQTNIAAQGKVEVNQADFTVLDYPLIAIDDVLVEQRTDRRYVVRQATRTELRGVPVHQKLVISELARDSIEYRIPIGNGPVPTFY